MVGGLSLSAIAELFNELLFGSGFWIGFIIISAFSIGISYKYKYTATIFAIVLFFMALQYWDNIAVDSNYMWGAVLCFVEMLFLAIRLYSDFDK